MKLLICSILVIFYCADCSAQSIVGSWLNVMDEGVWQVSEGCFLRRLHLRRYTLSPPVASAAAQEGAFGTYTNTTWFRWVKRDSRECAAPGKEPLPVYATLRGWELQLDRLKGDSYAVRASRGRCFNSFCDDPGINVSDFEAVLDYQKSVDRVIDRVPGNQSPTLTFSRYGLNQKHADEILNEFLRRLLDTKEEQVDQFMEGFVMRASPGDSMPQMRSFLRQYVAVGLREGTSFEVTDAYVANRLEAGAEVERILSAIVVRTDPEGSKVVEFFELFNDSGRWKLGSIQSR